VSANQCPCGVPVRDGFLCRSCSRRLERALGDLPALIADLDITLARQAVTGAHSEGKPTKKDSQPLPLHNDAAKVASNLRYVLATSVRYLSEARGIVDHGPWCKERAWRAPLVWRSCGGCAQPKDNPSSMARWLLKWHDSIRLDPASPDIASDIHGVTAAIVDVIDLPRMRGRFKVGMCPDTPCPGEVWVHLPAEDLGEPATMVCRACQHVWPTWEWSRAGDRMMKRGSAA